LVAPIGSPGVLDDPVIHVGSAVVSPAGSQDTVVEVLRRAVRVRVDSRGVELEAGLRSIDGNRGWSLRDRGLESTFVTRSDVVEGSEGGSRVGSVVRASSVFSGVWVAGFGINATVGDDVLHGLSHETSVASLVSLGERAIHEVLLREGNEVLGSNEVASFGGSSGGEGPA